VIRYPQGDGPFPLIVLAHGRTGNPNKFTQLTTAWASAGLVVAAPVFPLTSNQTAFETDGDYVNQPADVSFVIDQLVARSDDSVGPLAGRVDEEHIGVTGSPSVGRPSTASRSTAAAVTIASTRRS
jgi:predicted dienelactone hydrolase